MGLPGKWQSSKQKQNSLYKTGNTNTGKLTLGKKRRRRWISGTQEGSPEITGAFRETEETKHNTEKRKKQSVFFFSWHRLVIHLQRHGEHKDSGDLEGERQKCNGPMDAVCSKSSLSRRLSHPMSTQTSLSVNCGGTVSPTACLLVTALIWCLTSLSTSVDRDRSQIGDCCKIVDPRRKPRILNHRNAFVLFFLLCTLLLLFSFCWVAWLVEVFFSFCFSVTTVYSFIICFLFFSSLPSLPVSWPGKSFLVFCLTAHLFFSFLFSTFPSSPFYFSFCNYFSYFYLYIIFFLPFSIFYFLPVFSLTFPNSVKILLPSKILCTTLPTSFSYHRV